MKFINRNANSRCARDGWSPLPIILLAATVVASGSVRAQLPGQPLVCSITINSDDEINTFRKHLGDRFRFVELTDGKSPNDPDWFGKACRQDIKCDVLVISGHFSGSFFGNRSFTLPLQKLEEQSCSFETNRCAGILSHPKEVFLFGCNTLRRPDYATADMPFSSLYRKHRQAGLDTSTAVRLATTAKMGLYNSFGDRMMKIFSGAKTIYGFTKAAPEGPDIAPVLSRYLQSVPDYAQHLNRIAASPGFNNRILKRTLHPYAIGQMSAIAPTSRAGTDYQNVCKLYDAKTSTGQGVTLIDQLLGSGQLLGNFHAIETFATSRLRNDASVVRKLKNSAKARSSITAIARRIGNSIPYASIYLANIEKTMGWIDNAEYDSRIRKAALKLINTPTDISRHMARQIRDENLLRGRVNIKFADLPADFPQRPHRVATLGLLGISEPGIVDRMIERLGANDEYFIPNRQALALMRVAAPQIDKILEILKDSDDDEIQSGIIYLLTELGCPNPNTKKILLELAAEGHLQPVAVEQLNASMPELTQNCRY